MEQGRIRSGPGSNTDIFGMRARFPAMTRHDNEGTGQRGSRHRCEQRTRGGEEMRLRLAPPADTPSPSSGLAHSAR